MHEEGAWWRARAGESRSVSEIVPGVPGAKMLPQEEQDEVRASAAARAAADGGSGGLLVRTALGAEGFRAPARAPTTVRGVDFTALEDNADHGERLRTHYLLPSPSPVTHQPANPPSADPPTRQPADPSAATRRPTNPLACPLPRRPAAPLPLPRRPTAPSC